MVFKAQATLFFVAAVAVGGVYALASVQNLKIDGVAKSSPKRADKVVLSDAEWKKKLTPAQYKILRSKGTDPAFCGANMVGKGPGVYKCAGCGLPLFNAVTKFESGTGWPSFYDPIDKKNIWVQTDTSYNMVRTEVLCARCDGHLGHVFSDGPKPTGLRYCLNGNALVFVPEKKSKGVKN